MSRKARKLSKTNIYHVVIKGLDRQIMFEEEKDYLKYLDLLDYYSRECHFELYAYCIMTNHVHLVINSHDCPIDKIFRKINTHYATWFNMKYQRTGHLQQDRFFSEPIEDEKYLLSAIRYVHLNPYNAGCESEPGKNYKWNSIYEYLGKKHQLINTDFIYNIISPKEFIEFHKKTNGNKHIDIDTTRKRIPDDVAKDIVLRISYCSNSTDFQNLPLVKRDYFLQILHEEGLSIRQLNRLTGIPKGIIMRAVHKENCEDKTITTIIPQPS